MPRKYIIVYDIFGVLVTVHPICRNPAHQLAIRKKKWTFQMETLHGVQMLFCKYYMLFL